MSGHRPWRELRERVLTEPGAAEEVARHKRALLAELSLAELRRARAFTQARLAEVMGKDQPAISRIEREADLYLSTLRSYVEAMGGELRLTAVFPDGEVPVRTFGGIAEDAPTDSAGAGAHERR